MSRKSRSVNSVDKKLEAVSSTMTADKDPLHHIEQLKQCMIIEH